MTVLPFVCLGFGIAAGIFVKAPLFIQVAEKVLTISLIVLMLAIGLNIGKDNEIISRFGTIGLQCIFISLSAIAFSVLFTLICEKTILHLDVIDKKLEQQNFSLNNATEQNISDKKETNHLVWIIPGSIIAGLIAGIAFGTYLNIKFIDATFTLSLVILYICVGISQGSNREVFRFVRILGFKVVWLSVAIVIGSVTGGVFAGLVLDLPLHISVISAGGMSFYSITGAYMTQAFGLEIGTYGFIVNVLREFFTVLLMPLLIKISLGSPIAGGAAADMDSMLAPISKFVGVRLGLVTLITGTILTLIVPFLLPILSKGVYMFN